MCVCLCVGRGCSWLFAVQAEAYIDQDSCFLQINLYLTLLFFTIIVFLWRGGCRWWLEARLIPLQLEISASRSGSTNGRMHTISLSHLQPSSPQWSHSQGIKPPKPDFVWWYKAGCEAAVTPQHVYALTPFTFGLILLKPGLAVCVERLSLGLCWPDFCSPP